MNLVIVGGGNPDFVAERRAPGIVGHLHGLVAAGVDGQRGFAVVEQQAMLVGSQDDVFDAVFRLQRRAVQGVVDHSGNQRLVRIAFQKGHHDLVAGDRVKLETMIRPGIGVGHPQKAGPFFVVDLRAIPVELDLGSAQLVHVAGFAGRADHHCGMGPENRRLEGRAGGPEARPGGQT